MSKTYTLTAYQIIKDAFMKLEMITEQDELPADYNSVGLRTLNMMTKLWAADPEPIHLWLERQGVIFLVNGQNRYTIGGTSPSTSGVKPWSTTTTQNAAILATTITVTSVYGMSVGQNIRVAQDDGTWKATTISAINSTTLVVTLNAALTVASTAGARVFVYTDVFGRPEEISSVRLFRQDGSEIPVSKVSANEYFNYTNKTASGTGNSYYCDMQQSYSDIYVYPTPDGTDPALMVTFREIVDNFDSNTSLPQYPDEWAIPLIYNLAVYLAPNYGISLDISMKAQGEKSVTDIAAESLETLKNKNSENADINLYPNLYFYNYD